MSTFIDVIPLLARQTPEAGEALHTLRSYFYTASLNGTNLQRNQPANAEEVRHHMHERADFLYEPNATAFRPPLSDLEYIFGRAHLGRDKQAEIINIARGAMSRVIDRLIPNGQSQTDNMSFRDEASTEATLAVAHHLGWN